MIVRFLKWLLSKLEPQPTLKETLTAWPFPEETPKPKRKPRVAKATTRPKKPVAKKATTVAKKTTKKAK